MLYPCGMASIASTDISTVTAGANPDSVEVDPRIWTGAPIRQRNPAPPVFTNAGLDIHLHNDPDLDTTAVVVITAGTDPSGLWRSTDPNTGENTLYGEPSPRRFDVWGPGGSNLSLTGPTGAANDVNAMGVSDSVTFTQTVRALPVVVTGVINCFGFFQGLAGSVQPLSTIFINITATVVGTGGTGTPVVVASELEMFYGSGGSTTISLPAVTFDETQNSTYTLAASASLRYRGNVTVTFPVSISALNVGLQCIEYTSV